jgi:S1-C subfamily serine protease
MDGVQRSVVKVLSQKVVKSYVKPDVVLENYSTTGSGFVYATGGETYIITNAHCVDDTVRVMVKKYNESYLYEAKVAYIAYECDLAVLEIVGVQDNKNFYQDMVPIMGGLVPAKLEKVYVLGYPLGGLNISITKGVFNRIQIISYFGVSRNITYQIDAAINHGNSGGPVVGGSGSLVGIAFAGESDADTQNMGYVIPVHILEYVLKRVTVEGRFDRSIGLGIETQMLGPSVLGYHKLGAKSGGVLVTWVYKNSMSVGKLRVGDVLLSVGGAQIDSDGTIAFSKIIPGALEERVPFSCIISLLCCGDKLTVEVWRNAKLKTIGLIGAPIPVPVPVLGYMQAPKFVTIGGLIFQPLTRMLIHEKRREGSRNKSNKTYVYGMIEYGSRFEPDAVGDQAIVLGHIDRNENNEDFPDDNHILDSVNGTHPQNINDLEKIIKGIKAGAKSKGTKYIRFTFIDTHNEIVIPI